MKTPKKSNEDWRVKVRDWWYLLQDEAAVAEWGVPEKYRVEIETIIKQALTEKDAELQEALETFAHAIMSAAHANEISHGTGYVLTTHTLIAEIKKLLPGFSYHGYRAKLVEKAREEERGKILKELQTRLRNFYGCYTVVEDYLNPPRPCHDDNGNSTALCTHK